MSTEIECRICGDVHVPCEPQETVYLPMDCPNCGRQRLEWDGCHVICEKCHVVNWQHPSRGEPLRYEPQYDVFDDTGYWFKPSEKGGTAG